MPPTIESGPDHDVTLFAACDEASRSRTITIRPTPDDRLPSLPPISQSVSAVTGQA
jgi:hypothetical protein